MRLAGKIALITGAGAGIGRACALAFVHEGGKVALMGRKPKPLQAVADEIARSGAGKDAVTVVPGDLKSLDDIRRAVLTTVGAFGGLNVLVNNAGILHPGTSESLTEAEWEETFSVNVKALWLLTREALPELRRSGGGSIVNISSVLGLVGMKNRLAYSASKGAVTLMTKCMAMDHAEENIRVNCICPGVIDTKLLRDAMAKAPDPKAALQQRLAMEPIGRLGTPEDIAGCAVYLASDEAAWVTGAAFPVDGGYTAW